MNSSTSFVSTPLSDIPQVVKCLNASMYRPIKDWSVTERVSKMVTYVIVFMLSAFTLYTVAFRNEVVSEQDEKKKVTGELLIWALVLFLISYALYAFTAPGLTNLMANLTIVISILALIYVNLDDIGSRTALAVLVVSHVLVLLQTNLSSALLCVPLFLYTILLLT
jgi:hypothetical protein